MGKGWSGRSGSKRSRRLGYVRESTFRVAILESRKAIRSSNYLIPAGIHGCCGKQKRKGETSS